VALPIQCNMPDLNPLLSRSAQGPFLLHQLIGAGVGFPDKMASYRRNLVRLADKAVRNYCDVRKYVMLQIAEQLRPPEEMARVGRILYMHEITNSLEDCIITTRRLFRYFERIKSDPSGFPLERLLKRRIEVLEDSIRGVRNLIEHLDDDIRKDKLDPGQTTAPVLDGTASTITMAGIELPVTKLAKAVEHFHAFALDFAQYRRKLDGTYEPMPKSGPVGS